MPPENEICELYQMLLCAWNERNAAGMAALFETAGRTIGFDGSELLGRAMIKAELAKIFAQHPTPVYIATVRGVHFPRPDVAILSGVAGMIPRGKLELNPALNAVQTLVAVKIDQAWCITLFQNTPAAYHGRPELSQALTDELRQLLPRAD